MRIAPSHQVQERTSGDGEVEPRTSGAGDDADPEQVEALLGQQLTVPDQPGLAGEVRQVEATPTGWPSR